ncbi:MAG TPA: hypothetical protein VJ761_08055, partial [Ktedonobacteraceae bacterium]|nr:hypothetical protein [Ktedonobacteraceae bacterium]
YHTRSGAAGSCIVGATLAVALPLRVAIALPLIALAAFIALLNVMVPGIALASGGPAHTETLMAGPYIIDVNLYQDPPMTDQSVKVTVVPHQSGLHLSGSILVVPGLGTDAVELRSQLLPVGQSNTLVGSIRMPVRGAWNVVVQVNGPQGSGQASFPITVAAPGAIPIWLGWLIALVPLLGVAWLVWHQRRYRRKLLARVE